MAGDGVNDYLTIGFLAFGWGLTIVAGAFDLLPYSSFVPLTFAAVLLVSGGVLLALQVLRGDEP